MRKFHLVFITLFILIFFQTVSAQSKYKTYYNARYGFSISYPSSLLAPQKAEDVSSSGEIFLSKDKETEMRVWGEYNALEQTLERRYNENIKDYGDGVTYKILLKNGYVISGVKDEKIFYQKTLRRKHKETEVFYTFTIEYKKSDRKKFDPVIRQIADSFKYDPNADV